MHTLDVPMYRIDALVRRAASLQMTDEARRALPDPSEGRKSA